MRRIAWRQVAIAGLALLLLVTLARTAYTGRRAALVAAEWGGRGRWLNGTTIVVDPGHGGDDPGAVVGDTKEKKLVLEISQALESTLEEQGAKVILTRDEDKSLGGRLREELGKRVAKADEHDAQVYVSIHANKDNCVCWGAQSFYQRKGNPAGKELAVAIQNQLRLQTPTTRVALPANFFVLRKATVPAAMVEVGFLTNARERAMLQDRAYQRTLATAIAMGVADFFKSQVPETDLKGYIGQ
ncbi:MAG TPA: N-acetylmuramoyl-L-alanine amidase [Symbiobacteriaceae bacterium]|nr:N-acetylmuramoyl-L-alanine amidase [Symbiobacteriaceae bacterium]